jgi:hypothetical protein
MGGNTGYSNGFIPESMLVTFATGWNSTDGNWKHQLSPGTYAKHLKLVALAKARKNRTLEITEGWGAYRPYDPQVLARRLYGNGAAYPGTSSHGGFWENQQTLAIDYGNWGWVYDWDRAAFYEDVRDAGLTPGLIHPDRGNNYPDEPWHVVDLDPWAPPPAPIQSEEDDEMLMLKIDHFGSTHLCSLGNGVFRHFISADPYDKIKNVARIQDDWQSITSTELPAFLRTYGCDLQIWDVRGGAFVVLDPLDGSVKSGNMWSATNAARSTIAQVKVTSEQTAKYISELAG